MLFIFLYKKYRPTSSTLFFVRAAYINCSVRVKSIPLYKYNQSIIQRIKVKLGQALVFRKPCQWSSLWKKNVFIWLKAISLLSCMALPVLSGLAWRRFWESLGPCCLPLCASCWANSQPSSQLTHPQPELWSVGPWRPLRAPEVPKQGWGQGPLSILPLTPRLHALRRTNNTTATVKTHSLHHILTNSGTHPLFERIQIQTHTWTPSCSHPRIWLICSNPGALLMKTDDFGWHQWFMVDSQKGFMWIIAQCNLHMTIYSSGLR